ncbi:MAG TPA: hypothetical protein VLK29_10410, partial [Luteimonas sp.]|nr:hypothetical protein [Luteimonas sp.]
IPKNGGGQRQGGERPPGRTPSKPAHRAHGKPAARGPQSHAGPKTRSGGQPAFAGRRDTRA